MCVCVCVCVGVCAAVRLCVSAYLRVWVCACVFLGCAGVQVCRLGNGGQLWASGKHLFMRQNPMNRNKRPGMEREGRGKRLRESERERGWRETG